MCCRPLRHCPDALAQRMKITRLEQQDVGLTGRLEDSQAGLGRPAAPTAN